MLTLSALLASNLPLEAVSAQEKSYVTYTFVPNPAGNSSNETPTVTLLESRSVISSSGTTGLRTWEAALHLGAWLCSSSGRELVQGKRVLELGAGTGLLSILCVKDLAVSGIVITDGDEGVVDAIKTNVFLNEPSRRTPSSLPVRTAALKWGWPLDATSFAEDYGMEAPQVLLGADIVSLVRTVRHVTR
jgi:protein-lysine N-methyltransferase EEF2KMT